MQKVFRMRDEMATGKGKMPRKAGNLFSGWTMVSALQFQPSLCDTFQTQRKWLSSAPGILLLTGTLARRQIKFAWLVSKKM